MKQEIENVTGLQRKAMKQEIENERVMYKAAESHPGSSEPASGQGHL